MKIYYDKVTWYSRLLAVILGILIFYVGFNLGQKKQQIDSTINPPATATPVPQAAKVTIKSKNIKEENFSGKVAVVEGDSSIATAAQTYIDGAVNDFRTQANKDVPDMRREFGADSPTAQYEIDIDAKYLTGPKYESVTLLVYTYTGGAHGSSVYKVFTQDVKTGTLASLSQAIKSDKQAAFTSLVKTSLKAWIPKDSTVSPVFTEDVDALTFSNFTNWSLDSKNLTIYFDQYAIGPGVLGPVAFPIPIAKLKDILN